MDTHLEEHLDVGEEARKKRKSEDTRASKLTEEHRTLAAADSSLNLNDHRVI